MPAFGIAIVRQYDRAVVFRFGKFKTVKEPGFRVYIPIVDSVQIVSFRTQTMPIQSQKIITKDTVSIAVAAVAYFRRVDAAKSIIEVESVFPAIYEIAQTTVRNVVGQSTLQSVLSETETLNEKIRTILDHTSERWGVVVQMVELKDIVLPQSMEQAMAREAEAEREKRAKIIAAEGEALSAQKLGEAADVIAQHPIALQLRNLQILLEIADDKNSTIIFPATFMESARAVGEFIGKEMGLVPPVAGGMSAIPFNTPPQPSEAAPAPAPAPAIPHPEAPHPEPPLGGLMPPPGEAGKEAPPAAGWYQDPWSDANPGQRRFWDGAMWTGRTAP